MRLKVIDEVNKDYIQKFHLVKPTDSWVLAEQETHPRQFFSLQKIAEMLSFEKVGDLYEVRPN